MAGNGYHPPVSTVNGTKTMTVRLEDKPATPNADSQAVDTGVVACDGTGPGSGHPRVYLTFGDKREITCPYCSRTYVLAEGAKRGHH